MASCPTDIKNFKSAQLKMGAFLINQKHFDYFELKMAGD